MVNDRSASVVLRRAAKTIEQLGWIQGDYILKNPKSQCGVCSLGALRAVYGGYDPYEVNDLETAALCIKAQPALVAEAPAVDCLERAVGSWIPNWNDRPERTQQEVLDAFEAAAAIAETEGH